MSDFTVDKARITASFIVLPGHVEEIRTPDYVDLDDRGVLLDVYLSAADLEVAHARWLLLERVAGHPIPGSRP